MSQTPATDTRTTTGDPALSKRIFQADIPGRICLFGDKTDLAGLPVIAATVTCTLTITAKKLDGSRDVVLHSENFPGDLNYCLDDDTQETKLRQYSHPLKYWCAAARLLRPRLTCGFEASVDSRIPIGKGLASSGAVSVALVRALDTLYELGMKKDEIAEMAYDAEHNELGIPCGRMDQYAISHGGVTLIQTGESPSVTPLSVRSLPVVVGDTMEPRPLKTMLTAFRKRLADSDPIVLEGFKKITEYLYAGSEALTRGDLRTVGSLMCQQFEQENLMGAATARLNELCRACCDAGACGAKQLGAGGGGCMVALCDSAEAQQRVAKAIEAVNGKAWILDLVTY
ncbi:GHMP kinase [Pelomyxa schiedti]|nr:GHMP kinase [Pelomyxa schiedti]